MPAPYFQLVSKPNNWSKSAKIITNSQGLTKTKEINLEYWTAFKAYLDTTKTSIKCQKPLPQHWSNYAIGKSNFYISSIVSVRDNFIRVDFSIDGPNSKTNYQFLKDKYESESYIQIDKNLVWDELPERRVSIVSLKKEVDVSDHTQWKNQHEWLKATLEKFDKFFRNKIKEL